MSDVQPPAGMTLVQLTRDHPRKKFRSGRPQVDDWLHAKALQNQEKHLSVTKVLLDPAGQISGYYTLASSQIDFSDLPADIARKLPKRAMPIALLAWLGVSTDHQGQGLGDWLLAHAIRDAYNAGQVFPFVALVLDCIDDNAKQFFKRWDFHELPGRPLRLFISAARLEALIREADRK